MNTETKREVILREKHNGKWREIRRMYFQLTETESMLLRKTKLLEIKLLRAKAALGSFEYLLQNPGMRVYDGMTDREIQYAIKILKELRK